MPKSRALFLFAILPLFADALAGQGVNFAVNQHGFLARERKVFAASGVAGPTPFQVVTSPGGAIVFTGTADAHTGDFGAWVHGDFTPVVATGVYRLRIGTSESPSFFIEPSTYSPNMGQLLSDALLWCRRTRRGNTTENWTGAPTHLDGIRLWNRNNPATFGPPTLTAGGHYEASDVRYMGYVFVWLTHALARVHEELAGSPYAASFPLLTQASVRNELRWATDFWPSVIASDGFVWAVTPDNWTTDNIPGTGDEPATGTYGLHEVPGGSAEELVYALLTAASIFRHHDGNSVYAQMLATRAFQVAGHVSVLSATGGGADKRAARLLARLAFYRIFGSAFYSHVAAAANDLLDLQIATPPGGQSDLRGFFARDVDSLQPDGLEPRSFPGRFAVVPIALALTLEALPPADPLFAAIRTALVDFLENSILRFDVRTHPATAPNALLMPAFRFYWNGASEPGMRTWPQSALGYRYTYVVGSLADGSSAYTLGLGTAAQLAGRILRRQDFRDLGTRLLGHPLGYNLGFLSFVENYGDNEAGHYYGFIHSNGPNGPFIYQPEINAGVKNGLRCWAPSDTPVNLGGWQSLEYWQVNQAHFMSLLAMKLRDGR